MPAKATQERGVLDPSPSCTNTILIQVYAPLEKRHAEALVSSIQGFGARGVKTKVDDLSWHIHNKYYQADVVFQIEDDAWGMLRAITGTHPATIILGERKYAPDHGLSRTLQEIAQRRVVPFEVALFVSYPLDIDDEPPTDEESDAWEDDSIHCGFEYVDVGTRTELSKTGERVGIARIVEALQTHLWEGAIMEPKAGPKEPPARRNGPGRSEVEDEDDDDAMTEPPLPLPRPFVPHVLEFPKIHLPNIPRASTSSAALTPMEFDDDFAPFVPPLASTSFPASDPDFDPPASTSKRERDGEATREEEEEADVDLEDLFGKLKAIRERGYGSMVTYQRQLYAEKAVFELLGEKYVPEE